MAEHTPPRALSTAANRGCIPCLQRPLGMRTTPTPLPREVTEMETGSQAEEIVQGQAQSASPGAELEPGVRVTAAAGIPPGAEASRGGGGRVTLSCCAVGLGLRLRLRARRRPAPAPALLGAGMERAPRLRPAARAHFLVSAPSSLLLAQLLPPSLPSLS